MGPRRFTSTTRIHASGSESGNAGSATMPALFTRMSSPPNVVTAKSIIARTSASRATSTCTKPPRPDAASIWPTVSRPVPSSKSATPTAAPSRASRNAVARPIPAPAPVTSATRPAISTR